MAKSLEDAKADLKSKLLPLIDALDVSVGHLETARKAYADMLNALDKKEDGILAQIDKAKDWDVNSEDAQGIFGKSSYERFHDTIDSIQDALGADIDYESLIPDKSEIAHMIKEVRKALAAARKALG